MPSAVYVPQQITVMLRALSASRAHKTCASNPSKRSPPEVPRAAAFTSDKAGPLSSRSLLANPERCWCCHPVVLVSQRQRHLCRRNRYLKPCYD